jgi:hypothetical protein
VCDQSSGKKFEQKNFFLSSAKKSVLMSKIGAIFAKIGKD